jgi:hypothetical protein
MWDPFWTLGSISNSMGSMQQAAEAANRADDAQLRVRELEHRVERLALACRAMWSLLQGTTGFSDQQLQDRIAQMDKAEGAGQSALQCPGCGRTIVPRRGRCMYCGAAIGEAPVFRNI